MKKLVLLVLIAVMMAGCNNNTDDEYTAPYAHGGLESYVVGAQMYTVIIDSCEYVGTRFQLAHKGNCKFCIERKKQKLREMIKELKEE